MIQLFGVVPKDVTDELPGDGRGITATSEGLNTTKIEKWILGGAGEIQALLERAGIDPELAAQEGKSSREVARNGIIAYAKAKSMALSMNGSDPRLVMAWEAWAEAKRVLTEVPSSVGKIKDPATGTHTTVNLNPDRKLTFRNNKW